MQFDLTLVELQGDIATGGEIFHVLGPSSAQISMLSVRNILGECAILTYFADEIYFFAIDRYTYFIRKHKYAAYCGRSSCLQLDLCCILTT